jgi:uncharacterized metal-binding protein YceD (DUF177 family)
LDDQYFKLIGDADSDIKKGKVEVTVSVKRVSSVFEFNFVLKGEVSVPCDRCLDDMPIDIETKNRLIVKFGKTYSEESDEVVIIPEDEGELNIAWFLYEFVTLNVPMKHVHPPGKCNKVMTSKLNKHRAVSTGDEESGEDSEADSGDISSDEAGDPRWEPLLGLIDEE